MVKELKHCRNVDDLECNDNVKHKARDFIKKYMAKYGEIYQRPKDEDYPWDCSKAGMICFLRLNTVWAHFVPLVNNIRKQVFPEQAGGRYFNPLPPSDTVRKQKHLF